MQVCVPLVSQHECNEQLLHPQTQYEGTGMQRYMTWSGSRGAVIQCGSQDPKQAPLLPQGV